MLVPSFVFTPYSNSFCVHIKNLEELSVEQIHAIEEFVKQRKGIFDFNSYSFVIQKRLAFHEFVRLIHSSSLNAQCIEKNLVLKEKPRVNFGQYKGLFYSELPDSYLLWLKNNYMGKDRDTIEKELSIRKI